MTCKPGDAIAEIGTGKGQMSFWAVVLVRNAGHIYMMTELDGVQQWAGNDENATGAPPRAFAARRVLASPSSDAGMKLHGLIARGTYCLRQREPALSTLPRFSESRSCDPRHNLYLARASLAAVNVQRC